MSRCLGIALCLGFSAALYADHINPGEIHVLSAGDKEVKAKPGDLVVARIPNPALPKMVSDVEVKASGAAKFVSAVNASDSVQGRPVPGSGHVRLYIMVKEGYRSGTVDYSYKDGAGKQHQLKLRIEIESK